MPSGLKRYYGDDHLHYLTWTCYHRQGWLAEAKRRDLFLRILEETRRRYRFVVVGYVVMPEHVHLLTSEPEQGTPLDRDASGEAALRPPRATPKTKEAGTVEVVD